MISMEAVIFPHQTLFSKNKHLCRKRALAVSFLKLSKQLYSMLSSASPWPGLKIFPKSSWSHSVIIEFRRPHRTFQSFRVQFLCYVSFNLSPFWVNLNVFSLTILLLTWVSSLLLVLMFNEFSCGILALHFTQLFALLQDFALNPLFPLLFTGEKWKACW